MNKIVHNTSRRRFDAMKTLGHHRQTVGNIKKNIRLLFGQDFLKTIVNALALVLIKSMSPLFQQPVDLGIFKADKIQLANPGLAGMPYGEGIRVGGNRPG